MGRTQVLRVRDPREMGRKCGTGRNGEEDNGDSGSRSKRDGSQCFAACRMSAAALVGWDDLVFVV
jgi:hypothetical protein